jgi:hypothetical protein
VARKNLANPGNVKQSAEEPGKISQNPETEPWKLVGPASDIYSLGFAQESPFVPAHYSVCWWLVLPHLLS